MVTAGEPAGTAAAHRPEPAGPPSRSWSPGGRAQGQGSCRGSPPQHQPRPPGPQPLQAPVHGLGVEVRTAPAHGHPGPGKGSGQSPLLALAAPASRPRRFGGRIGASSQGFCPSRLSPLSLQGHWLPLTLPPAEEQGQSWRAAQEGLGAWAAPLPPRADTAASREPAGRPHPAPLLPATWSQRGLSWGQGWSGPVPLGSGSDTGKEGTAPRPLVQPLLPAGGQKPGTSKKVPGPLPAARGAVSGAGWGPGSALAQGMPAWSRTGALY